MSAHDICGRVDEHVECLSGAQYARHLGFDLLCQPRESDLQESVGKWK